MLLISITDLLGREINTQTISIRENIDITKLPNGLYLLTATTPAANAYSGKFTKHE
ncbi:MAG: T9SS type A sorting domain-containing protein [Saprospiraceae bacterium]|nr:T9SS type A sorting domain-containing protein [Saprospiraceae bacterium]